MSSEADADRLCWARRFSLQTIHEATLEALLCARNYAVLQLLREHNGLLTEWYFASGLLYFYISRIFPLYQWRELLGAPKIEYSDNDFITPRDPDALLPYCITPSGAIVPLRSGQHIGGLRPGVVRILFLLVIMVIGLKVLQGLLREMVDASTQTDDPDTTLSEIKPPTVEDGVLRKKRKHSD